MKPTGSERALCCDEKQCLVFECGAEAGVSDTGRERDVRKRGRLNRGRRAVRKNGELNRGKRCDVMWVLPHHPPAEKRG